MRTLTLGTLVVVLLASSLYAQPGQKPPADFRIYANIDAPADGARISRKVPFVIWGWAFECRSGLMPGGQRIGSFQVIFQDAQTGTLFYPSPWEGVWRWTFGWARPDVRRAFAGTACDAVGDRTGFSDQVGSLPPLPGDYIVYVYWRTVDGQDRETSTWTWRRFTFID